MYPFLFPSFHGAPHFPHVNLWHRWLPNAVGGPHDECSQCRIGACNRQGGGETKDGSHFQVCVGKNESESYIYTGWVSGGSYKTDYPSHIRTDLKNRHKTHLACTSNMGKIHCRIGDNPDPLTSLIQILPHKNWTCRKCTYHLPNPLIQLTEGEVPIPKGFNCHLFQNSSTIFGLSLARSNTAIDT